MANRKSGKKMKDIYVEQKGEKDISLKNTLKKLHEIKRDIRSRTS